MEGGIPESPRRTPVVTAGRFTPARPLQPRVVPGWQPKAPGRVVPTGVIGGGPLAAVKLRQQGVPIGAGVPSRAPIGAGLPSRVPVASASLRPRIHAPAPSQANESSGPGRGVPAAPSKMQLFVRNVAQPTQEHELRVVFQGARIPISKLQMPQPDAPDDMQGVAVVDILIPAHEDAEVAADFASHRLSGREVGGQKLTVEVKGPVEKSADDGGAPSGGSLRPAWSPLQALSRIKQQAEASKTGTQPGTGVAAAVLKATQNKADPEKPKDQPEANGPPRFKTVICSYWKEDRCTRGAACGFAHGEHELSKPESPAPSSSETRVLTPAERLRKLAEMRGLVPPRPVGAAVRPSSWPPPQESHGPRKLEICRFWQEGRCTRGTLCTYAHGEQELHRAEAPPPSVQRNISQEIREKLREAKERNEAAGCGGYGGIGGWKGLGKNSAKGRPPPRARPDRKGRAPLIFTHEAQDTLGAAQRDKPTVLENGKALALNPMVKAKMAPTEIEDDPEEDKPSAFLLNEDGVPYLFETYGLGAQLLVNMGWSPGGAVGKQGQGRIEPVSVKSMAEPGTHFGRSDRRCIGIPPPNEYPDSERSDESVEAPKESADAKDRDDRRRRKRSRSRRSRSSGSESSGSRSRSRRRRRRKLRPKRRSPGKRGRSKSKSKENDRKRSRSRSRSSVSSSSSSRSSSSPGRRKRGRNSAGFGASAGASAAGNTAGAAGATGSAAPKAPGQAVPVGEAAVKEPPEIAQAKKQVLAKLTVLKNVEPKDQRMKEFRQMLREWHPDKNPERIEMATAVFQFLQKGKSLLNLK